MYFVNAQTVNAVETVTQHESEKSRVRAEDSRAYELKIHKIDAYELKIHIRAEDSKIDAYELKIHKIHKINAYERVTGQEHAYLQ